MVEFHAKLATLWQVYIPKIIVERWMLWQETLDHIGDQAGFESRMIS